MSTVRPLARRRIASPITASVMLSSAEVISSRSRIGLSFKKARAMATRCFSPPESAFPPGPTWVSSPAGSLSITESSPARFTAVRISSSVASGLASVRLSRMDPLKRRIPQVLYLDCAPHTKGPPLIFRSGPLWIAFRLPQQLCVTSCGGESPRYPHRRPAERRLPAMPHRHRLRSGP